MNISKNAILTDHNQKQSVNVTVSPVLLFHYKSVDVRVHKSFVEMAVTFQENPFDHHPCAESQPYDNGPLKMDVNPNCQGRILRPHFDPSNRITVTNNRIFDDSHCSYFHPLTSNSTSVSDPRNRIRLSASEMQPDQNPVKR